MRLVSIYCIKAKKSSFGLSSILKPWVFLILLYNAFLCAHDMTENQSDLFWFMTLFSMIWYPECTGARRGLA